MGRKDRERYLRLKQGNPGYRGFRGAETFVPPPPPVMESVVCSVCQRKRNVAADTLPDDRSAYVCLRCQDELPVAETVAPQ